MNWLSHPKPPKSQLLWFLHTSSSLPHVLGMLQKSLCVPHWVESYSRKHQQCQCFQFVANLNRAVERTITDCLHVAVFLGGVQYSLPFFLWKVIQATITVRLTLFHYEAALDKRLGGWYELNASIKSLSFGMEQAAEDHGMALIPAEFAPGSLLWRNFIAQK